MDKSREQFEAWYAKYMKLHVSWYNDGNIRNDLTTCEDGSYVRTSVRNKWESWQASRVSIEIEVPHIDEAETRSELRDVFIQSVEDLGLKVKQ